MVTVVFNIQTIRIRSHRPKEEKDTIAPNPCILCGHKFRNKRVLPDGLYGGLPKIKRTIINHFKHHHPSHRLRTDWDFKVDFVE
jgi:hypothetical protein